MLISLAELSAIGVPVTPAGAYRTVRQSCQRLLAVKYGEGLCGYEKARDAAGHYAWYCDASLRLFQENSQ